MTTRFMTDPHQMRAMAGRRGRDRGAAGGRGASGFGSDCAGACPHHGLESGQPAGGGGESAGRAAGQADFVVGARSSWPSGGGAHDDCALLKTAGSTMGSIFFDN